ncbi:LysR family transcriptional regulator [Sphingomonas faeni]|uniref:LysR family transcriptional regulator n=1 Tax=Sphingomonas faeni TaxID=185950 RepID=UPI00277FE822|nr:LysR family transcriptional regulator [Sphingomonas faeni]MDQ0840135.1 DNA-binding transcriptional LysR family regulator [Sphingomonas faeni]
MNREHLADLADLVVVAEEGSFTRAAARLGMSQPALSAKIRRLEARLGVRLLSRTTRNVAPTEAGERFMQHVRAGLAEIDAGFVEIGDAREKPAGTVRLTTGEFDVESVLWPKLLPLLRKYPDINIEICSNNNLVDLVAERFDAGIRFGDQVAQDMISVRIGPDIRMLVVGAPNYLDAHDPLDKPSDLTAHQCINMRMLTVGNLYAWELEKDGKEERVRVSGQLTFNRIMDIRQAAIDGFGLAYLPDEYVAPMLEDGRLRSVLDDWCPPYPGFHLYYPSRRQPSSAFTLVADALRHRNG